MSGVEFKDVESVKMEVEGIKENTKMEVENDLTGYEDFEPFMNGFGVDYIKNLPVLDIGKKKGITDYIDFIGASDMKFPIMKGIDTYRRPFIAIKYNIEYNVKHLIHHNTENDESEPPVESAVDTIKEMKVVNTFFRRYTNSGPWVFGTAYPYELSIYDNTCIYNNDYTRLAYIFKELKNGNKTQQIKHENSNPIWL